MAATALIQLTQGANVGTAGQALFGSIGTSVVISNNDNTAVASWQIDLLYVPPGSSLLVGTLAFNNNSSTPSASFTPDVRGPYRIALSVWNSANRSGTPTDIDIRNFGIKELNGIFRPAPQLWPRPLPPVVSGEAGAKPDENNFGGQSNGWSGSGSDGLLDNALSRIDAAIQIGAGTQTATSGPIIFSNSNGISFGLSGSSRITASYTVPSLAGLLTEINISGGTTSNNLSAFVFSNSNNVSFGLNGSTITASITVPAQTVQTQNIVIPSAGTQTATSGTVVFANSNGFTFGMSGNSQITASYTVPSIVGLITGINLSGGTTSNNLTAFVLSNSNNISFGLNGSTITASASYSQSTAPAAISAGTTQATNGTIIFSNSNGISFGMNNGVITATVNPGAAAGIAAIQGGTQTATSGTVIFANSNGISFGLSGSTQMTASVATSLTNINFSAGTTSNNLSALVFSNSNNVSFGLNGSTVTATITVPAQTNQTAGLYAVGNTAGQSSSSTFDARTISFSGAGIASVGYSAGNVIISVPAAGANINISAGTTSNNLNAITFSNSNNVSFGLNGSTLTGSIATSLTNVNLSAGTTSNNLSVFVFSNSNGISFGLNGSTVTGSIATSLTNVNVSAGTTSNNLSAFIFSNSNNVSFGLNGSTITATITVPAQTNQTIGLFALGNTTQSSSTTLDARSLSLNGLGAVTVGYTNGSIQISAPVQTVQTQSNIQAIYDGANSISTGTIRFTNANGVSFSINGQTISGSVAAQTNQTIGLYALGNTTQNSSTTMDARTLSFNGLGAATVGYSNGSIQISVPNALTNINISGGTTSNNLTNIVFSNSNGISFGLNGSTLTGSVATSLTAINMSAGTTSNNLSALTFANGNGVSFGLNASTITASIATSLTGINLSAGTTSNNLSAFVFSNSNNVSFGLNGSTVTATISVPAQTVQTMGLFALGNTTQNSSTTFDARTLSFNGLGGNTVGYSNGSIQISGVTTNNLISAVNFSAGTTSTNANAIIFSNSNNFTFGLNGNTITASFNGANAGIGAVSAGTQSKTSGTLIFSNSNNISFGMSGSNTITASYSQSNQTIGFYAVGNTTQNSSTTLDGRTLLFNALGAMTIGYSNGSIQISAPASSSLSATGALSISVSSDTISIGVPGRNVSHLMWPEVPWGTNFSISNASFSLQHFNPKADIVASRANLLMALSGNSGSTGALTISMGIYTMSGSTMSLASSDSRALTWTSGSTTSVSSAYGGISGTRYRTVSLANWSITAGDYMLGMWYRTTNDGTWRAFGIQGPSIVGAADANETNQYLNGFSTSSYTTAMLASVNVTDTNFVRTGGNALQQPSIIFLGSF